MGGMAVRLAYDSEADAAIIYLIEDIGHGGAPRSVICDLEVSAGAVILLLDPDDHLVGFEILGASRLLPSELLLERPTTN
jgi:uncharacterized protein YuzE